MVMLSYPRISATFLGVVETGLFINMAEKVYFGSADGSVKVVDRAAN